jgi:hypothetical protein
MKTYPIIFSGPMARALLENRKTMTRRVMNPQPEFLQFHHYKGKTVYDGEARRWCWKNLVLENIWDFPENRQELAAHCPYGKPGDLLWVRESAYFRPNAVAYAADNEPLRKGERVEGILPCADYGMFQVDDRSFMTGRGAYMALWESINGPDSWEENPRVWVLSFKTHHCNVDEFIKQKTA